MRKLHSFRLSEVEEDLLSSSSTEEDWQDARSVANSVPSSYASARPLASRRGSQVSLMSASDDEVDPAYCDKRYSSRDHPMLPDEELQACKKLRGSRSALHSTEVPNLESPMLVLPPVTSRSKGHKQALSSASAADTSLVMTPHVHMQLNSVGSGSVAVTLGVSPAFLFGAASEQNAAEHHQAAAASALQQPASVEPTCSQAGIEQDTQDWDAAARVMHTPDSAFNAKDQSSTKKSGPSTGSKVPVKLGSTKGDVLLGGQAVSDVIQAVADTCVRQPVHVNVVLACPGGGDQQAAGGVGGGSLMGLQPAGEAGDMRAALAMHSYGGASVVYTDGTGDDELMMPERCASPDKRPSTGSGVFASEGMEGPTHSLSPTLASPTSDPAHRSIPGAPTNTHVPDQPLVSAAPVALVDPAAAIAIPTATSSPPPAATTAAAAVPSVEAAPVIPSAAAGPAPGAAPAGAAGDSEAAVKAAVKTLTKLVKKMVPGYKSSAYASISSSVDVKPTRPRAGRREHSAEPMDQAAGVPGEAQASLEALPRKRKADEERFPEDEGRWAPDAPAPRLMLAQATTATSPTPDATTAPAATLPVQPERVPAAGQGSASGAPFVHVQVVNPPDVGAVGSPKASEPTPLVGHVQQQVDQLSRQLGGTHLAQPAAHTAQPALKAQKPKKRASWLSCFSPKVDV